MKELEEQRKAMCWFFKNDEKKTEKNGIEKFVKKKESYKEHKIII